MNVSINSDNSGTRITIDGKSIYLKGVKNAIVSQDNNKVFVNGIPIEELDNTSEEKSTQKYRLIGEGLVKQIEALINIPEHNVSIGDRGGFISVDSELSQEGNCWIDEASAVLSRSKITGDVLVESSKIKLGSQISGAGSISNSTISDSSISGLYTTNNSVITKSNISGTSTINTSIIELSNIKGHSSFSKSSLYSCSVKGISTFVDENFKDRNFSGITSL